MTNNADEEQAYLLVECPVDQIPKIRRLIHAQAWYIGTDVPVYRKVGASRRRRDYFGIPTGKLIDDLRTYFENLKYESKNQRLKAADAALRLKKEQG